MSEERIERGYSPEFQEGKGIPIVSVADILPGISKEGLILKGQSKFVGDVGNQQEIQRLRKLGQAPHSDVFYADESYLDFLRENPEICKGFERFKGQVVVDLGAGSSSFGYLIADKAQAAAYVGVEPNFWKGLQKAFEKTEAEGMGPLSGKDLHKLNHIPAALVVEDMRSLLKRIPDKSVSIWMSGMEILLDQKYRDNVRTEILRVLHDEGAYISGGAAGHITLKDKTVEKTNFGDGYGALTVYSRKPTTE